MAGYLPGLHFAPQVWDGSRSARSPISLSSIVKMGTLYNVAIQFWRMPHGK